MEKKLRVVNKKKHQRKTHFAILKAKAIDVNKVICELEVANIPFVVTQEFNFQ